MSGAPGFIHMFIKAYKVFGHERYLKEAESCANVIWKRGLLKVRQSYYDRELLEMVII